MLIEATIPLRDIIAAIYQVEGWPRPFDWWLAAIPLLVVMHTSDILAP